MLCAKCQQERLLCLGGKTKRWLRVSQSIIRTVERQMGYRRIHEDFHDDGLSVGETRVRRLMKQNGIKAKAKRKFKMTTDSNHAKPIHENALNRNFKSESPNQNWLSDITYIPTKEGWLYLAVILDLFSRKIVD